MVGTTAAEPWVERQWPPDDTEESIVGSEYHQHVIDAVRDGLRMAARANEASWHVLSQVPIAGFRRPNGAPYVMLPDVFVHPLANPRPASGQVLTFPEVGVPLLADRRWTPWPLDAAGRWASAQLGVSFAFDGLYLRVYDAAGRLKPLPDEADAMLRDRDDRLRRARALLEAGDLDALRQVLESDDALD
jgi:hypothetical protein